MILSDTQILAEIRHGAIVIEPFKRKISVQIVTMFTSAIGWRYPGMKYWIHENIIVSILSVYPKPA
jgi:hypothetical protein